MTIRPPAETPPEIAPATPTPSVRGPWRGRLARVTGAFGALALTGAVAAVGLAAPVPADVATPPITVTVPPPARTLVCPGPLAQPDDTGAGDSAFDPTPVDTLTELRALTVSPGAAGAASSGTLTSLAGGAPLATLEPAGTAAAALRASGVRGPTLLRAEPAGDAAPRVAGATASLTTAGDLRGLAAASCQPPAAGQWLVGGSTEIGSSALLVVTNPGATPAEVSLEVFGPSGPVHLAGAAGFLVAPGSERAVLLEGMAAEQRLIAVHVSATGGLITAHLQDNRLNGFTPAGTDLVSAGTAPATRQVVGGLVVTGSAIDAPDAAQVRLLAPGHTAATARISLLGPQGPVALPGADTVELTPGEVTDLSLGGLPAGAYTAVVDADEPIVAAAMITRPGLPGQLDDIATLERAWGGAAVPGTGGVVALPARVAGTVLLTGVGPDADGAGGGAATGTLRIIGTDGAILNELPMSVPAGTTVAIPVASLAGAATVAGLDLVLPDRHGTGAVLAWSVLASFAAADGDFVSVLSPVPDVPAPPSVDVRRVGTLGLP